MSYLELLFNLRFFVVILKEQSGRQSGTSLPSEYVYCLSCCPYFSIQNIKTFPRTWFSHFHWKMFKKLFQLLIFQLFIHLVSCLEGIFNLAFLSKNLLSHRFQSIVISNSMQKLYFHFHFFVIFQFEYVLKCKYIEYVDQNML